jgi:PAS domain S-box-containing protein
MRFGFRARLLAGFSVVLVLLSLVAAVGIKGMADLRALTDQMTSNDFPGLYYAEEAASDLLITRESLLSIVLAEDDLSRNNELRELQLARARFERDFVEVSKDTQETILVQQVGSSWIEMDLLASAIVDDAMSSQPDAARASIPRLHVVADRTDELLDEIVEKQKSDVLAIRRSLTDAYDHRQAQTLVATGLALLLGLATAIFIGTRTTRAVGEVARAARHVSGGNLAMRARVKTGDELQVLAEDFNTMAASLERQADERHWAETALRESEARYRCLMEQAGDGIIVVDSATRVLEANPSARELLGYEADSLIGTHLRDLVVPDDMAAVPLRAPPMGQTVLGERRMLRRDRREVPVEVSITSLPDGRQLGILRDVTKRKDEQQRREALAQAEKMRALGQMASGIAHDLNQSLMLVASYSDLARSALDREPPDRTELRDLFTTATQAALDGGESVKRLLLFTRQAPERGSEPVDLATLVRDVAQMTAPRWRDTPQAEGRPICLHVEADGHPNILGSAARLREVMTNLVFNAVDALPAGGTIRLVVGIEAGNAVIRVIDSGVGMSLEVQARIFEPFYTTKGGSGNGLGLSIAFGIVKQHGGSVAVHSAPAEGTTLELTFPLLEQTLAPAPVPEAQVKPATVVPLRVLAVDDEPSMTRAVARMLRPGGHSVRVAGSGEEALECLAAETFDVVISDMGLGPGMNGWDLADAVKQRWPKVRFVLATGWGAAIDPVDARARGVETVLAKPYRPVDLEHALAGTWTAEMAA